MLFSVIKFPFLLITRAETNSLSFSSHRWGHIFCDVFSSSFIQLYDLGSPAESSNTVPGCSFVDGQCTNMEQLPSCGKRGHCHGEWGSFSCTCQPGFVGPQCDQGKPIKSLVLSYDVFSTVRSLRSMGCQGSQSADQMVNYMFQKMAFLHLLYLL